ncbi:MAG: hypothetical protein J6U54_23600 [Clostridiales bacterium]|nr:hypothetical protein [Clostridiales bacterium]
MTGDRVIITMRDKGDMMQVDVRDKFPSKEELDDILNSWDYVQVTVYVANQRESYEYEKEDKVC